MQEEAVFGETPNLAARLQGLAMPGQVVIGEGTRRLLGDVFELSALGRQSVKGIAEPVQVFAVIGERALGSRFEARRGPVRLPMVGRDQELALLLERWAQSKAGEGQGVLLVGEAGIGKSRISRALLDALALYELRTYTLYVGKLDEARALYQNEGWPALEKHAEKLIGYFIGDVGAMNQIIHVWKFADDADRRAFWQALFADEAFMTFARKLRPLILEQQNKLMFGATWGPSP